MTQTAIDRKAILSANWVLSDAPRPLRASMLQEELSLALKALASGVDKKNKYAPAVLRTVKLAAADYSPLLSLETSNLSVYQVVNIGAKVESGGAVCIEYGVFSELTALLSPDRVDLIERDKEPGDARVCQRCGTNQTWWKYLPASEFPARPDDAGFVTWGALALADVKAAGETLAVNGQTARIDRDDLRIVLAALDKLASAKKNAPAVTVSIAYDASAGRLRLSASIERDSNHTSRRETYVYTAYLSAESLDAPDAPRYEFTPLASFKVTNPRHAKSLTGKADAFAVDFLKREITLHNGDTAQIVTLDKPALVIHQPGCLTRHTATWGTTDKADLKVLRDALKTRAGKLGKGGVWKADADIRFTLGKVNNRFALRVSGGAGEPVTVAAVNMRFHGLAKLLPEQRAFPDPLDILKPLVEAHMKARGRIVWQPGDTVTVIAGLTANDGYRLSQQGAWLVLEYCQRDASGAVTTTYAAVTKGQAFEQLHRELRDYATWIQRFVIQR